ncbi:MAG: universal stress protein [Methanotrichaceae archaeon]|nr:universal stress protein [Methanotrichaceae archaeon]
MFERVLVPTDFSEYAQKTLECIGEIPGIKEVLLLNIIDANDSMLEKHGWSYDSLISEAKAGLDEQMKHIVGLGPKVRPVLKMIVREMSGADGVNLQRPKPRPDVEQIMGGNVADAIQKTADEEKVSLIVMGAKGKGLVKEILLGSVSKEVLRHGRTNLLIIRHKLIEGMNEARFEKFCPNIFSRVLVTTDFSEAAAEVLSFVKGMDNIRECALVHVVSRDEDEGEAMAKLNGIRDDFAAAGRKVTAHILEGNPSKEIISLADKLDASLIIMSYQGSGMLEYFRVGSTTFDVAYKANRPVMVLRPRKATIGV